MGRRRGMVAVRHQWRSRHEPAESLYASGEALRRWLTAEAQRVPRVRNGDEAAQGRRPTN